MYYDSPFLLRKNSHIQAKVENKAKETDHNSSILIVKGFFFLISTYASSLSVHSVDSKA